MAERKESDVHSLWQRYKAATEEEVVRQLRNQLIETYLYLVGYNAERIWAKLPDEIELDDLISAGNFGLMDAIEAFDLARGIKFETYCSARIRGAILDSLRDLDWAPRLVRYRQRLLENVRRELEMERSEDVQLTEGDIAARLKLSERQAHLIQTEVDQFPKTIRLTVAARGDDDEVGSGEVSASHISAKTLTPADLFIAKEWLNELLVGLPRRERLVLLLYYYEELTMAEIGKVIDISESRVSQIHSDVLEKLRDKLNANHKRGLGVA